MWLCEALRFVFVVRVYTLWPVRVCYITLQEKKYNIPFSTLGAE